MKLLSAVDLFAGAGGLSTGLEAEGFQINAAVEIDPVSAKSYTLNHQDTNVIIEDIRNISGAKLLKQLGLVRGELDLLTGCPPCQAFSTLRTRRRVKPNTDRNQELIIEVLRLVRSMRPRAVIVENVPGLAKDDRFSHFCLGLKKAGYRYTYAILNASDYDVPQRRKRMILVALRGKEISNNWSKYKGRYRTDRKSVV